MATRVVEGKKPYTGGKAIEIDENKVISLRIRDENNLIIYDAGDDEIYVDLQLDDEITPTSVFPVGVTTGRAIVDNGWDIAGTILVCKTTSGDNIKLLYGDNGKLYIDNGTGAFKQIYFKADVDLIVDSLQAQIDVLSGLGKFLSLWDCATGEPISFPLDIPYEYSTGDWYMINNIDNTTNYRPAGSEYDEDDPDTKEVETESVNIGDVYIYDGSVWLLQKNAGTGGGNVTFAQILGQPTDNTNLATALGDKQDALVSGTNIKTINSNSLLGSGDLTIGGDVQVSSQNYNLFTPGMKIWGGGDTQYAGLTPDSNTAYLVVPYVAVSSISLNESHITLTTVGQTEQLTATVSPNNATYPSVTWSSSDTTVATVSDNGLVTCVSVGNATITATADGQSATCSVSDLTPRTPGANTVVYYPFDGDLDDYSGNAGRDLTGTSVTFESGGPGQVAVFGSSSTAYYSNNSLFNISYPFTFSVYVQTQTVPTGLYNDSYYRTYVSTIQDGPYGNVGFDKAVAFANGGVMGYNYYNGVEECVGGSANTNTWYHVVYTFDGTDQKMYLNGNLVGTNTCAGSYTGFSNATLVISSKRSHEQMINFQGKMSNFIMEDKAWTGQEVSDYFNSTKSYYGIS